MKLTATPLILALLAGTGLHARDFDQIRENIQQAAWRKIAFVYLAPRLVLDNLGYNSNIYSYERYQTSDYQADLGGDVTGSVILGNRFIFSLRTVPYYTFYLDNKDLEAFNHILDFQAHTHLGGINLHYGFENRAIRQRPTFEFGIPIRMVTDTHRLTVEIGNQDHFFIRLKGRRQEFQYQDTTYLDEYQPRSTLQRTETGWGIGVYRGIFSDTLIHLDYERYQLSFAFLDDRDGTGTIGTAGIEFPNDGSITGSLILGFKTFDPQNPDYQRFTKPYGRGRVALRLMERLRVTFDYLADNQYSYWQEQVYYDHRSGEWQLQYYPGRRIRLGYAYLLGRLLYKDLAGEETIRTDEITSHSLTLTFRLGPKLGAGLKYTLYRADSDQTGFARDHNFIGGFITHDF